MRVVIPWWHLSEKRCHHPQAAPRLLWEWGGDTGVTKKWVWKHFFMKKHKRYVFLKKNKKIMYKLQNRCHQCHQYTMKPLFMRLQGGDTFLKNRWHQGVTSVTTIHQWKEKRSGNRTPVGFLSIGKRGAGVSPATHYTVERSGCIFPIEENLPMGRGIRYSFPI